VAPVLYPGISAILDVFLLRNCRLSTRI